MIENPYAIAIFGGLTVGAVGIFAFASLFSPNVALGFVAFLVLIGFAPHR